MHVSLCEAIERDPVIAELVELGKRKDLEIIIKPFRSRAKGILKGNKIGIREGMNIEKMKYTLAHEIAHIYLHNDKGDTIFSEKYSEYEEQADRAAVMILDLLEMKKALN